MNTQTSAKDQLNPLSFPPETNLWFVLIVLASAGALFTTGNAVAFSLTYSPETGKEGHDIFTVSIGLVFLVLGLLAAFLFARLASSRQIRKREWIPFPPESDFTPTRDALAKMSQYLENVLSTLPNMPKNRVAFLWDGSSRGSDRPSGMAFGFRAQQYVCLREGLFTAFVLEQWDTVNAVLYHELSHIANRDTTKTTFARSIAQIAIFLLLAKIIIECLSGVYLAFSHMLIGLLDGRGLVAIWSGVQLWISMYLQWVVSGIVFLLLIDAALSGFLRAREYYADTRARSWFGFPDPLIQELLKVGDDSVESRDGNAGRSNHGRFFGKVYQIITLPWQLWREKIAPRHPSKQLRADTLQQPWNLFRPSSELAFFIAVMSGLSLFMYSGLSPAVMTLFSFLPFYLGSVLLWIFQILLFAFTMLIPFVGTIGLQIQRASFANRVLELKKSVFPWTGLVKTGVLLGLGLSTGLAFAYNGLAALGEPIRMVVSQLLMLILWSLILALIFIIWVLPMLRQSGQWLAATLTPNPPKGKGVWMITLSAITLLPLLITSFAFFVIFYFRVFVPDIVESMFITLNEAAGNQLTAEQLEQQLILVQGTVVLGFIAAVFIHFAVWAINWLAVKISVHRSRHLSESRLAQDGGMAADVYLPPWAKFPPPVGVPLPPEYEINTATES